jgi:copper transport protein
VNRKNRLFRRLAYPLALWLLLALLMPAAASAHAFVTKAVPEPNSQADQPPKRIELEFNERIEDKLYYIKVLDEIGREAAKEKAQLNAAHNGLTLNLPELPNGIYIVTYHVISADGHPIGDSYPITVGPPKGAAAPSGLPGHTGHTLSGNAGVNDLLLYASRIANYLGMLLLTGWLAWSALLRREGAEGGDRQKLWGLGLQRAYLITLLFLIVFHYKDLLGEGGLSDVPGLFTGTTIGLSWLVSLLLSLIGFVALQRFIWLDWLWIAVLLAAKAMNGHAMAYPPMSISLTADWIHLIAASLWSGGLLFILVHWKDREFLRRFIPRFSRTALWALLVLMVTGSLQAARYLPKLSYLFLTQWGTLLLIKTGLVLLVLAVGFVIRLLMRKRNGEGSGIWIKVDFSLMVLIVGIVGLLTYIPPVPANVPLDWHEMGTKAHITLRISPNAPGPNNITLKVWLPENPAGPKDVELRLIDNDDPSLAPITVPIKPYQDNDIETSFGFTRYSYQVSGPYLPFAGDWTAEVRVLDANADETVYTREFRIY